MSKEHNEPNGDPRQIQRAHAFASIVSLGMSGAEIGFGIRYGNTALVADAVHNIGDVAGYLINWFVSWRRHGHGQAGEALALRRFAMGAIMAGAVATGAVAAMEIDEPHVTGVGEVGLAVVAAGANFAIRRRFDHVLHDGADPETHDSHNHAYTDTLMSLGLVGGVSVAATGVADWAEPVTGLAVASYTAATLNPWKVHRAQPV